MKALTLLLSGSLIAFAACKKAPATPAKKTAVVKNKSLVIGNPLDCGIENLLIFPVGTDYKPEIIEAPPGETAGTSKVNATYGSATFAATNTGTNDRLAVTEYVNQNENEFDIRNILFYDLTTRGTFPLVKDTVHILSFALHKEFANPLILYRVVKKDLNGDTLFNSADPVMLFVSDIHGKNFTQVTPDNEQFIDYFYYPQTNTILAKTVIDSDGDKKFTVTDETNFRELQIKEPAMGKEIFAKSLKDSLRLE